MNEPFLRNLSTFLFIIPSRDTLGVSRNCVLRVIFREQHIWIFIAAYLRCFKGNRTHKVCWFQPLIELCISIACFQMSGLWMFYSHHIYPSTVSIRSHLLWSFGKQPAGAFWETERPRVIRWTSTACLLSVWFESQLTKGLLLGATLCSSDCIVARLKSMNHSFTAFDGTSNWDAVTAPN